jgi:beta-lactamase regulating signal transducer with metallopeptidase domain
MGAPVRTGGGGAAAAAAKEARKKKKQHETRNIKATERESAERGVIVLVRWISLSLFAAMIFAVERRKRRRRKRMRMRRRMTRELLGAKRESGTKKREREKRGSAAPGRESFRRNEKSLRC